MSAGPEGAPPRRRARLAAGTARVAVAALAGVALYLSFPPRTWWWAAPVAFALTVPAFAPWGRRRPVRAGMAALAGLAVGLGFFLPLLPWVGLYVGAEAWLGLSLVEALYLVPFGLGAAALVRLGLSRGRGPVRTGGRVALASVGLAGWWCVWEWVRSSWPWGGFPWGVVAFGQADGPFLPLAGLLGETGLSFVVAATGFALGLAGWAAGSRIAARRPAAAAHSARPRVAAALAGSFATVAVLAGLTAAAGLTEPAAPAADSPHIRVAVVQGNVPRLGLDFNAQRRAVLDNHVAATRELADSVAAGRTPRPDVVLWPEDASDVSPLANPDAAELISDTSRQIGAPILVGSVLATGHGQDETNTMLVWDGENGPVARHDKRYIQPYGEWLPWRGFWERLFPIAKTAGHFVPGDDDGVVTMAGTRFGVATCYEVAFDGAFRRSVAAGAQVLTVPTNNATFGRSPMTYQQLGMSRVRAVEFDRPVLVAATSGVSAVVDTRGHLRAETGIFEQAVLVGEVPTAAAGSVSSKIGAGVDVACRCAGVIALLAAVAVTARRRRPGSNQETE